MAPIRCIEERWNGVLRDRLNVRTRKTHAFAKTTGAWDAWVILCWFEQNGLRPHRALREAGEGLPEGRRYRPRTPAMAIGWTDPIWTWEEFLTFKHYQYHKGVTTELDNQCVYASDRRWIGSDWMEQVGCRFN
jgi:hypothetical protein